MSTSVKMISIENEDTFVYLTYEPGWKKAKFYSDGSLIYESNDRKELIEGVTFEVPKTGVAEFKISATTYKPTLYVNNDLYLPASDTVPKRNDTVGATVIFSFLSFFNFIPMMMGIAQLNNSPSTEFDYILSSFFAFCFVAYGLSAILLYARKYLFYFIGTGLFTLTTLFMVYSGMTEFEGEFLLFVSVPRFIIIGLLLIYAKRVLRLMKNVKSSAEVIDGRDF